MGTNTVDLTKPANNVASMALALGEFRQNIALLLTGSLTPYSVTAASTCGTTSDTNGFIWKITGNTTVTSFDMPGTMVFAHVQDGFLLDGGGNVKNAPFFCHGNSFLFLWKDGSNVYAYPVNGHGEEEYWNLSQWQLISTTTASAMVGCNATAQNITTVGTLSNSDAAADGEFLKNTAAAGASATIYSTLVFNPANPINFSVRFKTPSSLTSCRFAIGMFPSLPTVSNPLLANESGFGLEWIYGTDTYWTVVNNDGGATARRVASTIAPATSTMYSLLIEHDPRPSGGAIRFYLDGKYIGGSYGAAQDVPVATATMYWYVNVWDQATVAPYIEWARTRIFSA